MGEIGWVKVFRHILSDKGLWKIKEPYDSRSAYMYLVLNAQYKDSLITGTYTKQSFIVPEGALLRSLKDLSEEWAWSIGKTRRFLNRLVGIRCITVKSTRDGTLITLINYGKTDSERHPDEQTSEHNVEQGDEHGHGQGRRQGVEHAGGTHNKKVKKVIDIPISREEKKGAPRRLNLWEGAPEE